MREISREFVTVGDRQVHYRRAGDGPPVVLLHESPRSSAALARHAVDLSARFCAIALDTPGYGSSDPLPLERPEIADYADALVETLDALGIERCGLYGALTGSLIALDAASRHPGRFAAVVLDNLPVFSEEERDEFLERYLPPFEARPDGTHMLWAWHRFRDQHVFFPWYRAERSRRLPLRMPGPGHLHEGAMEILRARDGYRVAYAAAFRYRPERALGGLAVPTALVVRGTDMLGEHLDRVPALSASCVRDRLPGDRAGYVAGLERHLAPALGLPAAPPPPGAPSRPGRITRTYVSTALGQLLARQAGDPASAGRPLLLVHGSPGGALPLEPLALALSRSRPVVALDLLGNGDSDAPPWQEAEVGDYVRAVEEALDRLGLRQVDVYATHTGTAFATELALVLGSRLRGLVLDGVPLPTDDERERLRIESAVSLDPRWDGTHLYTAWQLVRDSLLWWPWFERRPEHALEFPFYEDPELVTTLAVELLKSAATHAVSFRAALGYPLRERLTLLRGRDRVLLCAHAADPVREHLREASELAGAPPVVLPGTLAEIVELLEGFLDGGTLER